LRVHLFTNQTSPYLDHSFIFSLGPSITSNLTAELESMTRGSATSVLPASPFLRPSNPTWFSCYFSSSAVSRPFFYPSLSQSGIQRISARLLRRPGAGGKKKAAGKNIKMRVLDAALLAVAATDSTLVCRSALLIYTNQPRLVGVGGSATAAATSFFAGAG
jgi:hypothetical protein